MSVSFGAIAQPNPGGVLLIEVPEKAIRSLGPKKRVPVRVTLNGVKYRSTIAVYGNHYYLPARREIRDAAKLEAGRRASVTLEVDAARRTVDVPADLARALAAAKLRPAFDALSYTRRKEIAGGIEGAKRPDTRAARVARAVAEVRAKKG